MEAIDTRPDHAQNRGVLRGTPERGSRMTTKDDDQPDMPGNDGSGDALTPEDIAALDELDRMVDEHLRQAREAGPGDAPPPPVKYDLRAISMTWLADFPEERRRLIVEEAQRLQERLWQNPLHADKARRSGGTSWLDLARSYGPIS